MASSIFSPLIEPEVSRTTASEMGARFSSRARVGRHPRRRGRRRRPWCPGPARTRVWLSETMPWTPGPGERGRVLPVREDARACAERRIARKCRSRRAVEDEPAGGEHDGGQSDAPPHARRQRKRHGNLAGRRIESGRVPLQTHDEAIGFTESGACVVTPAPYQGSGAPPSSVRV